VGSGRGAVARHKLPLVWGRLAPVGRAAAVRSVPLLELGRAPSWGHFASRGDLDDSSGQGKAPMGRCRCVARKSTPWSVHNSSLTSAEVENSRLWAGRLGQRWSLEEALKRLRIRRP
jgi:hypothetical protein